MASLFADIKTPYVNEVTLKRLLVPRVKQNIFQKIVVRPEEGVTEKFSSDTDAAELQVIRVKPNGKMARNIGSTVNGDYFNGENAATSTTEAYGIKILSVIDYNIDIPQNMQDMLNIDMVDAEMQNLSGKVAQNVNAVSAAAWLQKLLNHAHGGDESHIIKLDATPTGEEVKNAIIDANSLLDAGNESMGIDTYPRENRAIYLRNTLNATLKKGGVIIGGSNYGQDILQKGGLDKDTRPDNVEGYLGELDGVPVYLFSDPVFNLAAKYLGFNNYMLSKVKGFVVSSIGTGRALAFNAAMKIIDAPSGQGRRMQPKYRFGAECWDAMSIVAICDSTFENYSDGALTLEAPASRVADRTADFGKGEGTSGTDSADITVKSFGEITLPANPYTYASHTFVGWKSSVDNKVYAAGAKAQMPAADVTFTAQWETST